MKPVKEWHKKFFRKEIFFPGEPRRLARAPLEAGFIAKALRLKKGERVLDLCCGTGRHSLALARRGMKVVGLDFCAAYLREAPKQGRGAGNVSFVRGDMRRLGFRGEFDAVINIWTSFGYFTKASDDLKVLKGVARALKPGGRFFIEMANSDFLRKHGHSNNWERRPDGAFLLDEFRMVEGRDPYYSNTWTILRRARPPLTATFFVRSYDFKRLAGLMRRAGLIPARVWGSLDLKPFRGAESRRLVMLAKKA